MKVRIFSGICVGILLILLQSGCARERGNTLLEGASPETCSLSLYTYDEELGNLYVMSDPALEEKLLTELSAVPIEETQEWSHEQLEYPIYGLEIGASDGRHIELAWSNGYCVTSDGKMYEFVYDFEKLISDYQWSENYPFTWKYLLPCINRLCVVEDGWETLLLEPAEKTAAPEGISMVIIRQRKDSIQVEFSNNSKEDWIHGTYYSIQVLVDGIWYTVPGMDAFPEIAIVHPSGKTLQETYDLKVYGELPPGQYRLEKEGLTAEFEISE